MRHLRDPLGARFAAIYDVGSLVIEFEQVFRLELHAADLLKQQRLPDLAAVTFAHGNVIRAVETAIHLFCGQVEVSDGADIFDLGGAVAKKRGQRQLIALHRESVGWTEHPLCLI